MATDYSGLDAENDAPIEGIVTIEGAIQGDDVLPVSVLSVEEQILAELKTQTALLHEFVQAINQVGDMFSGGDGGKPVSPMSMISKALFR